MSNPQNQRSTPAATKPSTVIDRSSKEQLKQLEADLWSAADNLRANSDLKSSEYATPVLGLIREKLEMAACESLPNYKQLTPTSTRRGDRH